MSLAETPALLLRGTSSRILMLLTGNSINFMPQPDWMRLSLRSHRDKLDPSFPKI